MDADGADHVVCDHLFHVFALLGKRWNGLIIGALLGGPARFSELERGISGIGGPMLSRRLVELAEVGLVERHVETGPPVEVSYQLTPAGEGLRPSVEELRRWGERFCGSPPPPACS
ncbi:winged helix-turn-helix transcriptional regulator [Sphaerisporangium rhizosphaerae]|uniref:Winged helix-turn-helix transcriptional regulator n=1 Tax=Sphaerisporangium rhizosphaerae TaxID=2269375 RepID=A0ABW2P6D8_9ACTN